MLKLSSLSFIIILIQLFSLTSAHNVLLPAHGKQCFFETLKKNDELAVSFQVGNRDPRSSEQFVADFYIVSPSGRIVKKSEGLDHGDESIRALESGKHQYCFSNEKTSYDHIDVSFNVHGVIYVDVNDPTADTLDYAIKKLSQLTNEVKNEQSYLVIRERTHRNTAESTNARVKWWSVFQLVVVAVNSLFQIYYLKRFFEVKTVV